MSDTLKKIKQLVLLGDVRIFGHAYDELAVNELSKLQILKKKKTKYIHEGKYAVEVDIE